MNKIRAVAVTLIIRAPSAKTIKFMIGLFLIQTALLMNTPAKANPDYLSQVERKYRASKSVTMKVHKTVHLKLLDKDKDSDGILFLKKGGRLRWETQTPDKSLIVINRKAIWVVEYPHVEGEKISVLKSSKPKKDQPQAVVAFLMGKGLISDRFQVSSEKEAGEGSVKLDLSAKDNDEDLTHLQLTVDKKHRMLTEVQFEDVLGNQTKLDFSEIKFNATVKDVLFVFHPPSGANVTNMD